MRAPLQTDILLLIADGFHRPRDLVRVLNYSYRVRPETVWKTVSILARRRSIHRVRRGWYEAE